MLALRALAGLKWLRVRGSRYANEQAMIVKWLDGVVGGTRRDWQLGHEIALCGRLIKGYGATNERGKVNLLHVLDHLAQRPSAGDSARGHRGGARGSAGRRGRPGARRGTDPARRAAPADRPPADPLDAQAQASKHRDKAWSTLKSRYG